MKPQKYLLAKGWSLDSKNSVQAWLLDAAMMMAGAWIFLIIGHILLRIMLRF